MSVDPIPGLLARIERLEEEAMFAERRADELAAHVLELSKAIERAERRLDAAEDRERTARMLHERATGGLETEENGRDGGLAGGGGTEAMGS